jgi:nitrite reductase/ring-hydroxylating ferredoxin subunit/DMSO/TMAO reductase YedYZ heme-binding membrane subunit
MSAGYQAVLWNKYKKQYDVFLWAGIVVYLGVFIGLNTALYPYHNANTILIRAFGTLAILLLHIILAIGPLCRLNPKFLPLLYNRRHLGVSMFLVASAHAVLSLLWFHGGGNVHPLVSLFASNTHYGSFIFFPFQTLGFAAWIILLFMAVTSHDFWLNFLTPRFWKTLHILVYLAYALLILHIALGIIQYENSPVLFCLLLAGVFTIISLHLAAAIKENKFDKTTATVDGAGWEYVCNIGEIEDNRAKMAIVGGERVAIFKYDGKLSAVHNVCKHQMGPLGEGKVVDGCITCPWHGYQYRPEDGCIPTTSV